MRRLLLALSLVALPLASCTDPMPVAPNIATANFDPSLGVNLAASTVTASGLYYRDVTVGSGATVPATGNTSVRVNYTGYFRSGTSFDSGVFDFTTNDCCAIDGMDEGVRGMQVGGTRQLIIPPHLGYGSQRYGNIPGNSILVFTVTLTNVFAAP